jgi:hypothetical protein
MQSLRYRCVDIRMFHDDTTGGVLMLPIYHCTRQDSIARTGTSCKHKNFHETMLPGMSCILYSDVAALRVSIVRLVLVESCRLTP